MRRKFRFFIMTAAALLPALSAANEGCQKILILGNTQATGQTSFVGDAESTLGPMSVDVVITSSKANDDGSINARTSHTFMVGTQVFTTRDRARLTPVNEFGLFRLDTKATIVEGAWGHLKLQGLLNFATGHARWLAKGQVCSK